MKILVTGTAGFIGYHVAQRLLGRGDEVIGIDNVNDYYDVRLKEARLARLDGKTGYQFIRQDIADRQAVSKLFADIRPQRATPLPSNTLFIWKAALWSREAFLTTPWLKLVTAPASFGRARAF